MQKQKNITKTRGWENVRIQTMMKTKENRAIKATRYRTYTLLLSSKFNNSEAEKGT